MRLLITGASGFIGKSLIERLQGCNHEVLALTRSGLCHSFPENVKELLGDLGNLGAVRKEILQFNPDVLIHLAWQGIPDYGEATSKANLEYSINLIDFLLKETACSKIIVSGSCFEYAKLNGSCKEGEKTGVNSFFSWAKQTLCQYLEIKCKDRDVRWYWARIFYVYGPNQRAASLIPTLIQSFRQGAAPDIQTPHNANDFIYVDDVADAFMSMVDQNADSGIYNLGRGKSCTVYDVCKIVEQKIMNSSCLTENMIQQASAEQTVNFWADISKAKKALSWEPKIEIEDGIEMHINSMSIE
jgi:dTDP-6-deoxy-L-talose 4-dehydrogenase (NAD+)